LLAQLSAPTSSPMALNVLSLVRTWLSHQMDIGGMKDFNRQLATDDRPLYTRSSSIEHR
jgi:hypothetical protein